MLMRLVDPSNLIGCGVDTNQSKTSSGHVGAHRGAKGHIGGV